VSVYKKTGALFLGTRLKRLSDKFFTDLSEIYKAENISFEISWFPVFYLLDSQHEVTISYIAQQLEITHSGASQMVTSLKKKGLVQISQVCEDKRIKTVTLTVQGREKLAQIKPIWNALQESMVDMDRVDPGGPKLLGLLDDLEEGMSGINLVGLVQKKLCLNQFLEKIEIIEYTDEFHEPFMALVLGWSSENPEAMPENINWINHTRQAVLENQDTVVFLAVHKGVMIGACVATMNLEKDPENHDSESFLSELTRSELTLMVDKIRGSDHIVQVLLDKMVHELEKRRVTCINSKIDINNSGLLKRFQKNKFKLMEIKKNGSGKNACMRLSRIMVS
jgi:DNA-binding MarR family transcriptional regulator